MRNFTNTSFSFVQRWTYHWLIVVAACCWGRPAAAQIWFGDVYLQSQDEVDNFSIYYSNSAIITGSLYINGFDINNLYGLYQLNSIGGSLYLQAYNLYSLSGLNNLSSIGGDLQISHQYLFTFDGLNNLFSVGGNLRIWENQYLYSLYGLDNLSSINGDLSIAFNQELYYLSGLDHPISGINNLEIIANQFLSTCDVQAVCDHLGASGIANICCNGFASGCNSVAEVEAACGLVLPVELTDFRATIADAEQSALLLWRTASEHNNQGFDIERSTDARTWQSLAFVPGHGTTQEEQSYAYTDERPQAGLNYYRLKQVDFDGKFEYSEVRSVIMQSGVQDEAALYPNPAHAGLVSLNYYAAKEGALNISVFDALGRLMIHQNQALEKEQNLLQLDFSPLTPGTYSVQLDNGAQRLYRTLTIQ